MRLFYGNGVCFHAFLLWRTQRQMVCHGQNEAPSQVFYMSHVVSRRLCFCRKWFCSTSIFRPSYYICRAALARHQLFICLRFLTQQQDSNIPTCTACTVHHHACRLRFLRLFTDVHRERKSLSDGRFTGALLMSRFN